MELVGWLRTLTFGGSLGAAIGAWVWVQFPSVHQIEQAVIITIAAGIGLGFSSLIARAFSPLVRTGALYARLAHLQVIKRLGIMPPTEVSDIVRKMMQQHFVGKVEQDKPKAGQVVADLRKLLAEGDDGTQ